MQEEEAVDFEPPARGSTLDKRVRLVLRMQRLLQVQGCGGQPVMCYGACPRRVGGALLSRCLPALLATVARMLDATPGPRLSVFVACTLPCVQPPGPR